MCDDNKIHNGNNFVFDFHNNFLQRSYSSTCRLFYYPSQEVMLLLHGTLFTQIIIENKC